MSVWAHRNQIKYSFNNQNRVSNIMDCQLPQQHFMLFIAPSCVLAYYDHAVIQNVFIVYPERRNKLNISVARAEVL